MKQILPLELVGNESLNYNLFDAKGNLVYKKGAHLTPNMLIKFSHMVLYRPEVKKVKRTKKIKTQKLKPAVKRKHLPSVIKKELQSGLIDSNKNFIQKIYDGERIRLEDCVKSSKIILEEVYSSFDKLESIDQLRIYDEYTYSHNMNVSSLSAALGMQLGLNEDELKELVLGAFLHDFGKMKVPKEVLNKPARLDEKEFQIMKTHTIYGYKYIKENFDIPDRVARIALDHHEKFSGKGYPNGLHNQLVNKYAQITTIVDVYDALVSDRCYKKGMPSEKAIEILSTAFKDDFNPEMFEVFKILANANTHEQKKEKKL